MKTFGSVFGDVISDIQTSKDPDIETGLKALSYFWQAAQPLNSQMPTDFTAFLLGLKSALVPVSKETAWPGYVGPYYPNSTDQVFRLKVSGIGNMANVGGTSSSGFLDTLFKSSDTDLTPMTDDQIHAAMQALANQGGGKIPTDFNAFTAAFSGAAAQINFFDALWYTVTASVGQSVQAAEAVGSSIIDTGAMILKYKNYILVAAAILGGVILYMRFVPRKARAELKPGEIKANPRRRKRR